MHLILALESCVKFATPRPCLVSFLWFLFVSLPFYIKMISIVS